jgi:hypothetical protein
VNLVVLGVVIVVSLEGNESFEAVSVRTRRGEEERWRKSAKVGAKTERKANALRNKDRQPVPERPNDIRLRTSLPLSLHTRLLKLLQRILLLPLQRQRNIELNTRPRCSLRTPMPLIDSLKRLVDPVARLQSGVERLTGNGSGELTMNEDIGVPTDGGGEMGVDGRGETVMSEGRGGLRAGAEVLGGEHAASCHDADEGVEGGEGGVL